MCMVLTRGEGTSSSADAIQDESSHSVFGVGSYSSADLLGHGECSRYQRGSRFIIVISV